MTKIYSYVLRIDDGAAPNPFWEICTLTICKPIIRRIASVGDWVVGTGSKNSVCNDEITHDLSEYLVYAMKISDVKTLSEYDEYCNSSLTKKIPNWSEKDWRYRVGDCIYDFSMGQKPTIRKSVHNEGNRLRDLSGVKSLISDHFYYFGEKPKLIPDDLKQIIKKNQGHKKIENADLIQKFEKWILQFDKNTIYAEPQMKWLVDREITEDYISKCAQIHYEEEEDDIEETIC